MLFIISITLVRKGLNTTSAILNQLINAIPDRATGIFEIEKMVKFGDWELMIHEPLMDHIKLFPWVLKELCAPECVMFDYFAKEFYPVLILELSKCISIFLRQHTRLVEMRKGLRKFILLLFTSLINHEDLLNLSLLC